MNYSQSTKVLGEINKATKILLNCHRRPDPDSIGSVLALRSFLVSKGKKIEIVCPSKLDERLGFLNNYDAIKGEVDFAKLDFAKFDLLVALDSSSWDMVTDNKDLPIPNIPVVVVDHHATNKKYGNVNLVDSKIGSVGELLYLIFKDWKVSINTDMANSLLTAILGDTGVLRYTNTTGQTLGICKDLMNLGGNKDEIVYNFSTVDFDTLGFVGDTLRNIKINKKYKFVWSAVPYKTFSRWSKTRQGKDLATDFFAQTTKGTNFGIMMLEVEPQKLSISFRSRDKSKDVSKMALDLEGGGHKAAAGASILGLPFDKAVDRVLKTAVKFAKES